MGEDVFAAVGDSTRRRIVELLAGSPGGLTATTLASEVGISRQAAAKHLDILRAAGVVEAERIGREHRHRLRAGGLEPAAEWIDQVGRTWDARLARLARLTRSSERRRR